MKKIIAVLLLACLGLSICACEQADPATKQQKPRKENSLSNSDTCLVFCDYVTYDAEGNEIDRSTVTTNQFGLPESITLNGQNEYSFTYNDEGNLSFFAHTNKEEYHFDINGNCTNHASWINGEENLTEEVNYDSNGKILSLTEYHLGEEIRQRVYEYDKKGKLLNSKQYWGSLFQTWEYDTEQKLIKSTIIGNGDYTLFNYTNNGSLSRSASYNSADEEIEYTEYKYDQNGKLVKTSTYKYGYSSEYSGCTYEYDTAGYLICETYFSFNKETSRIEYVYDNNGNIIEKIQYEDGLKTQSSVYSNYRYQQLTKAQKIAFESIIVNNLFAVYNHFPHWSLVPYEASESTSDEQITSNTTINNSTQ